MIYITGDIHGSYDISKLNTKSFPIQKKLTRDDYLIICGDFGLVWDNSNHDLYWRKWLEDKPWTTLWIDGNHENFDLLKEYPKEDKYGGKIQKISEHVLHLCRGYVFEIDNKKIFAFGGAESHDKEYRKLGISMWNDEMPTSEEMEQGRKSLDAVGWNVDIVITHSLPTSIQSDICNEFFYYPSNELTDYFEEINSRLNFKQWFSGHYHRDKIYDDRYQLIYNHILLLNEDGYINYSAK